jgi:hypothetical protein
MSPDNFKHDDVTFQEPTTFPPQGVKGEQLSAPPTAEPLWPVAVPDWPLPPLAVAPPMGPFSPESVLQPELAASVASVNVPTSQRIFCRMNDPPKFPRSSF